MKKEAVTIRRHIPLLIILLVLTACGNGTENALMEIPVPPLYIVEVFDAEPLSAEASELTTAEQVVPLFNDYIITMDFQPETRTITGTGSVRYTNRSNMVLEDIVFRINLNAWNGRQTMLPYTEDLYNRIFRHGRNYGFMDILHVSQDNEELPFTLEDTVLTIFLFRSLEPNETTQLSIRFEAYIPRIAHRTGANDYALWAGAFLPVEALMGPEGWCVQPYYPIGVPFMLGVANYMVEITTPIGYMVAGTGAKTENTLDDRIITNFTAQTARDFAFAISDNFNRESAITPSGTEIFLYHYTEDLPIDRILNVAVETMTFFEETVGAYPYDQLSIVETDMFQNGAGFTNIIFVDSGHLRSSQTLSGLRHQIGRQWFSMIVGGNPIDEAWLNNGLVFLLQGGLLDRPEELRALIETSHRELQEGKHLIRSVDGLQLASGIASYQNWTDYILIQHNKARIMFYALYREMGEDNFRELLREYYNQFAFQIAFAQDFIELAEEIYDRRLRGFFNIWLYTEELPDLPR